MTAAAINSNMQPVIVISKDDIESGEKVADIYKNAGFEVFCTSPQKTDEAERLKALLMGKTSAFTGNSGVGKSTLLNMLFLT